MKLHHLIPSQLPEFIQSDYPAFIEFLQAYYQWYENEYSVGQYNDLIDIDNTVDRFTKYFRKQLDVYNILGSTDNNLFIRNIKQLYTAKGSEAGFKFLFKALFNKSSSVTYPWDYVFKPSAGVWQQDVSIIVKITRRPSYTEVDPVYALGGNEIQITDSTGYVYKVRVADIIQRSQDIFEIFVSRFSTKSTSFTTFTNTEGTIAGQVLPTTYSVKINMPGYGFEVGQIFPIASYGGIGSAIKIKKVNSEGGIVSVELIEFGYGYEANFAALITPDGAVSNSLSGSSITFDGPTGVMTYPANDAVDNQAEAGIIVRHDYTEDYVDMSYVGRVAGTFRGDQQATHNVPAFASLSFKIGSLCRYPGAYAKSDNVLGDLVYVEDSYYYQAFSYVTTVEATLEEYSAALKNSLHPSGTIHFGNYLIKNEFDVPQQLGSAIAIFRDTTRLYSGTDVSDEFTRQYDGVKYYQEIIGVTEAISKRTSLTPFSDAVSSVSDSINSISVIKSITDNVGIEEDVNYFNLSKGFNEILNVEEDLSFTLTKPITELAVGVVDDGSAFNFAKSISETTISANDSSFSSIKT